MPPTRNKRSAGSACSGRVVPVEITECFPGCKCPMCRHNRMALALAGGRLAPALPVIPASQPPKPEVLTVEQVYERDRAAALAGRKAPRKRSVCTQEIGCQCRGCLRWRKDLAAQAEEQQRALAAFKAKLSVPPAQDDSSRREGDLLIIEKNGADLRFFLPIRSVSQLDSKLYAEQDDHPRSQDWLEAPEGTREVYAQLAELARAALLAGSGVARVKIANPEKMKAQLEWLCKGNGAPLIEMEGSRFARLLRDPVAEPASQYPGCPEGVNPKAGKTFNGRLDTLVYLVRSTSWGEKLTQAELTRVINSEEFRTLYCLHEYRYASKRAVSMVHCKAMRDGTMRIVKQAVHYRQNHQWRLESAAVYHTNLTLLPAQEDDIKRCIETALKARTEEVREKLRAA